jgi:metal-responsive CopG/Arc/MetJ family transcriptional regulator
MEMKKRGRKGFGGIRVVVHLTEEILKALDVEVERRKADRISRAELIRRAIEARYLGRKRDDVDFKKREPLKQ